MPDCLHPRRLLVILVGVLACLPAAYAEDATDDYERAAESLIATPEGVALPIEDIQRKGLDPWVVAYELLRRGDAALAVRFASTSEHPVLRYLKLHLEQAATESTELVQSLLPHRKAISPDAAKATLGSLEDVDVSADPFLVAYREYLRAGALWSLRQFDGAMKAYEACADAARECDWLPGVIKACQRGAACARRVPDFGRNYTFYVKLRAAFERVEDAGKAALTTGYVGNALAQMGEYGGSLPYYRDALAQLRKVGTRRQIAQTYKNYGLAQRFTGDYAGAIAALDRSLELFRDTGLRAHAQLILGETHRLLGDFETAETLLTKAIEVYEQHKMRVLPDGLAALAVLRRLQGEYEEADQLLRRAAGIHKAAGNNAKLLRVENALAIVMRERGKPADALKMLREMRPRVTASNDGVLADDQLDDIGETAVRVGDWQAAREATVELLGGLADSPATRLRIIARERMARIHAELGDVAQGWLAAQGALRDTQDLLAGLGAGDVATTRAARAACFATAAKLAVQRNRPGDLVSVLERARIGTRKHDFGAVAADVDTKMLNALRARERLLRVQEAATRSRLQHVRRSGAGRKERRTALKEWQAAQDALRGMIARIQRESLRGRALYPRALSATEIQSALAPTDCLVLFGLLGDDGYAAVLTAKTARIVRLGTVAALQGLVDGFEGTNINRDPTDVFAEIQKRVVTALELPKSAKRVLISPDGPLFHVPLASMLPGRDVAFVVSGSAFADIESADVRPGTKVLALGDPIYNKERSNIHHLQGGIAAERGEKQRGDGLVSLPATRGEVEAVGDVKLLGKDSTEAKLREALKKEKRWRAVHLACHGLVDEDKPLFSSLALTQDGEDDGFLHAHEITQMGFNADLVVLSACETARGRFYKAFGVRGLTRSFLDAGASSVIVSLWKVDDEASGVLMRKFHELWNPRDGKTKPISAAAALRAAQAHVRANPKWKHPYYWAAWQVWGLGE